MIGAEMEEVDPEISNERQKAMATHEETTTFRRSYPESQKRWFLMRDRLVEVAIISVNAASNVKLV
ncbi:hypothetical protein BSQ44_19985 [Aquibium oceanicum]|uniref:Uncharacterized protein n=1 Tax=Aquibium oceanicum TaxID=1670800 RepID=A0A1L3SVF6_9HYPH|nr:hypothetical protein BSQ44_19985 [Aquibium oceanicum]